MPLVVSCPLSVPQFSIPNVSFGVLFLVLLSFFSFISLGTLKFSQSIVDKTLGQTSMGPLMVPGEPQHVTVMFWPIVPGHWLRRCRTIRVSWITTKGELKSYPMTPYTMMPEVTLLSLSTTFTKLVLYPRHVCNCIFTSKNHTTTKFTRLLKVKNL